MDWSLNNLCYFVLNVCVIGSCKQSREREFYSEVSNSCRKLESERCHSGVWPLLKWSNQFCSLAFYSGSDALLQQINFLQCKTQIRPWIWLLSPERGLQAFSDLNVFQKRAVKQIDPAFSSLLDSLTHHKNVSIFLLLQIFPWYFINNLKWPLFCEIHHRIKIVS